MACWIEPARRRRVMNKVERNIPSEIEAACERIQRLIATGYLPDALRRDLELLMRAATRADDAEEDIGAMIRKQQTVHRVEAGEIKNSSHLAPIASALGIPIEKVVIRKLSR
jgi:uncharacterized protein (DUF2236 family)